MVDYEDYATLFADYLDTNWDASLHDGAKPSISKGKNKVKNTNVIWIFDISDGANYTEYSARKRHNQTIKVQADLRIVRDESRFYGCKRQLEQLCEVGQADIKDHAVSGLINNLNRMWYHDGRYHNNEAAGRYRYVLDVNLEIIGRVRATVNE
ncbi:MAG: hypothetical protein GWN00_35600 [Aliifodinibius sp.]|nr:hypothetical protein [candidate division Zixibacteria bacterium]NIR67414.1 hypothetical protein [candidate division Zixibacteria bacterium]NIT61344.1 hypothetical protein [Fodinibius sp.]NIY29924.1 hypothetical protein [Fodinibius sp.]